MRDPRTGTGVPALQLSDRRTRCGNRWANLLLRSLRAHRRQDKFERPRLTRSGQQRLPRAPRLRLEVGLTRHSRERRG
jgi:hypothetical protein